MDGKEQIPVEQLAYTQALAELEGIVSTLQSANCDVDSMVALTKRAAALLQLCRGRLTTTEQQLRDTLAMLQAPDL